MKIVERIKSGISAAFKSFNWNASSMPGNISSNQMGRSAWIPGTHINWDGLTGEIISCPAVQACFNVIFRNLPQAPPVMREKDSKGELVDVPDHPLVYLLNYPTPNYDGATLRNMIDFSLTCDGNCYLTIERNGFGQPAQLWWNPHNKVTIPPDTGDIIETYIVTDRRGRRIEVPAKDMVHLKNGLNPDDPRFGLATLKSGKRSVYALQLATNYRANILRNFGTIGKFISAKFGKNDPKGMEFEPKDLKKYIDDSSKEDSVGSTIVTDIPFDVVYPSVTPKDMSLEAFEDRDEALVCALFGVPPQVALLLVGRLMKTDANWKEAREQFWEDCLMPLLGIMAGQLGHRLIPEFESNPRIIAKLELGFDFSGVRALQPDLDALHTRLREDWMANLITLAEWKMEIGRKPDPGDELIRYKDMATPPSLDNTGNPTVPGNQNQPASPKKSFTFPAWSSRIEAEINALEEMHAESEGGAVLNGNGKGH